MRIIYQSTLDGRVAAFLRKQGWDVIVAKPAAPIELAPGLSITVCPYFDSGDSYALVRAGEFLVLNINDCVVDTEAKAKHVLETLGLAAGDVTVLLTQFGYANWIGNEDARQLRADAAIEKAQRIAIQAATMRPSAIVPFASFVYFCHDDNHYLNDEQNTIDKLLAAEPVRPHVDTICVLAPGEAVPVASFSLLDQLTSINARGVSHWREAAGVRPPVVQRGAAVPIERLRQSATDYRAAMSRTFAGVNRLLEAAGVLKPVTFELVDGGGRHTMSYARGLVASDRQPDISCTSEVLQFVLLNEFGFNTVLVNGRFRATSAGAYRKAWRFFVLQDLKKMGFGVRAPVTTALLIARNARKFVRRRLG